jgi:plasmid stability protein
MERLRARAKRHRRSLEGEIRLILIEAAALSLGQARSAAAQWQKRLAGRAFGDSAVLIRQDRQR